MLLDHEKVLSLEGIANCLKEKRLDSQVIVHCHGHFNLIHPGHLRFLRYAKSLGDFLVISVCSSDELAPHDRPQYFSQSERADGVAHIEFVDAVVKSDKNVLEMISTIKADIYVKGKEFEDQEELIKDEVELVKGLGGKTVFSSGEIRYSFSRLEDVSDVEKKRKRYEDFLKSASRHDVSFEKLKMKMQSFNKLKIMVLGDTIVDEFISCDTLGISSEAPVMVVRELDSKKFIGGAAIIAQHIASLGAQCTFISVTGEDSLHDFVVENLRDSGVDTLLFQDSTRPTSFKIRYVVGDQKIFRVSRLKEHDISKSLEDNVFKKLEKLIPQMDGVVLSDFVYGFLTARVIEKVTQLCLEHNVKIFADSQCSSQLGDITKFKNVTLITPTEKEARISLGDKDSGLQKLALDLVKKINSDHVVITLGAQGLLSISTDKANSDSFQSEFFPALENNPVDVAGAGDAMLTGFALSICSGLNLFEASVLSSCFSARAIMRMGNVPLTQEEIIKYIDVLNNSFSNSFTQYM